ncbi:importin-11-like [Rhodnius prolixus]
MEVNSAHNIVLDTLQRAVSQNAEILKPAEQKLQEWETQPGFYSILKDVFCNTSFDMDVRLLAVLYFKNGVDKYWRPSAPNAIPENEKIAIRQSLLSNFGEPIKQIARHFAILTSKIARYDCPRQWPELIPTLMEAIKSEDGIVQHRSLLILHQVVKVLSSKRLTGDRRMFQELSAHIYPTVYSVWDAHCILFFLKVQENVDDATKTLENAILSLKILEKLTVHGFKRPNDSRHVNLFIKLVFERAKAVLSIWPSFKSLAEELAKKFIIRLTNVLLSLLEFHPFSFVEYISFALEFTVYYAFTPQGEPYLFERFLIQCFNLIKALILCPEYRPAKVIEDTKEPLSLKAHQIKQLFFDTTTLTEICRKLITHYFILTPQDLALWDSDPEVFAMDESGETWKYSLRPCIESLFATIFHEYRSSLAPLVVELVRENHTLVSPDDIPAILNKDAVYNAVGIAAFDLYDEVNFDEWFTSTLHTELGIQGSNYRIIRRRVAWLIGSWTGVKLSSDLHPMIYEAMIPLLKSDEDMVVRLTAANTIRIVVDVFEFNIESFLKYLEPTFTLLFDLLKEAQECDTKMRVLSVLSFIIERIGVAIEPYYNSFIQYLPLLWHESEPHNMLRCAVVATLVHLVKALGKINDSEDVTNFILSVISLSTDVRQNCHVYLLEDGLELWQVVVENTAVITPAIMQLFSNMPPLLEGNSEHLKCCLSIISAYALLAPNELLQLYGESLVHCCEDMLTDMQSEGVLMVMRLLELFIKVNPITSANLLKPLLPKIFEIIYRGEEFPMLMSLYLSILSRVLLVSKEIFIEVINKVSVNVNQSPDLVLNKIIDVWLDKMPLVSQLEKKKLLGLALSSLLTANSSFVYNKFCGILLAVSEVLNDITRTNENGVHIDALYYSENEYCSLSDDNGSFETEHDYRKKQLALKDPVHVIVLEEYFKSQMQELQRSIGQNQFDQFLQTVDVETLAQVREYVPL